MNLKRLRILQEGKDKIGPVVYWMQRDQRAHDNWALIYAQSKAIEKNTSLFVVFNLVSNFLDATLRQYGFMIKGLQEVEGELCRHNIHFVLTVGDAEIEIPKFLESINASLLIADFNPLKISRGWKKSVADKIDIPFCEVDAHNIVPFHQVSAKQEFAAYTIRTKIHKLLPEFLDELPSLQKMKNNINQVKIEWKKIYDLLNVNKDVKEIDWLIPGEMAAHNILQEFIKNKFTKYATDRNFPTHDAQSNLSPYFHFGHIAPQRVALVIQPLTENEESHKDFLEEMIVRRELSDNFCFFNKNYDSFEGFHPWAQESLNIHRKDKRDYIYDLEEFELAKTHEDLWNAAQLEMVASGKMHGYMRMYWAKKILEWSKSPEEAMKIAIYLNDKYELDGRDPNGYTGIAWSIGGVHDRPWFERAVYGKIRYMNYNGCAKKFDVKKYIQKHLR
ncbi:MAG: deoxyribodipyrimidine photo-lyase [Ignavibacteria bacterium]|nr:MAG: deoxyribodipyrimidine photo-lyase [Ignavibacteria bacterium]KAF0161536.1 MAG: deoxyribodipyrimidine photo-lyase [Ignavibacteria bacterium]